MTTADEIVDRADTLVSAGTISIVGANTLDELDEAERELLGKTSPLNSMREAIKSVDPADRPTAGKAVAAARAALGDEVTMRRATLSADARAASLVHDRLDLTSGGRGYRRGHLHPVTRIWRDLEDVFVGMGYNVAEGPEVESDWYNFESLNFPPGHPAPRCKTRCT